MLIGSLLGFCCVTIFGNDSTFVGKPVTCSTDKVKMIGCGLAGGPVASGYSYFKPLELTKSPLEKIYSKSSCKGWHPHRFPLCTRGVWFILGQKVPALILVVGHLKVDNI